jgi:phage terminase small subunit
MASVPLKLRTTALPSKQTQPPAPHVGKLGPCMEKLNPRQRAFVDAMLDTGGADYTRCAKLAGYVGGEGGIRVTAHRLAHDERIQAAIQEQARKRMIGAGIMATGVLIDIAGNPAHKDQLKAATSLLDRAGLHAITESKHTVHNTSDRAEQIREIAELAREMGADPVKLLGAHGVTIDADFTEIKDGKRVLTVDEAEDEQDDLSDILGDIGTSEPVAEEEHDDLEDLL